MHDILRLSDRDKSLHKSAAPRYSDVKGAMSSSCRGGRRCAREGCTQLGPVRGSQKAKGFLRLNAHCTACSALQAGGNKQQNTCSSLCTHCAACSSLRAAGSRPPLLVRHRKDPTLACDDSSSTLLQKPSGVTRADVQMRHNELRPHVVPLRPQLRREGTSAKWARSLCTHRLRHS